MTYQRHLIMLSVVLQSEKEFPLYLIGIATKGLFFVNLTERQAKKNKNKNHFPRCALNNINYTVLPKRHSYSFFLFSIPASRQHSERERGDSERERETYVLLQRNFVMLS